MDAFNSNNYPVRLRALVDIVASSMGSPDVQLAKAGDLVDGFLSPGACFGSMLRDGDDAPTAYKIKYEQEGFKKSMLVYEGKQVAREGE